MGKERIDVRNWKSQQAERPAYLEQGREKARGWNVVVRDKGLRFQSSSPAGCGAGCSYWSK